MDNVLKLHKSTVMDKLDELASNLFDHNNVIVEFDENMSIYMSHIVYNASGIVMNCNVGINQIQYSNRTLRHFFNLMISDHDFVHVILNMHHEQFHCFQKNQLFRQSNLEVNEKGREDYGYD